MKKLKRTGPCMRATVQRSERTIGEYMAKVNGKVSFAAAGTSGERIAPFGSNG